MYTSGPSSVSVASGVGYSGQANYATATELQAPQGRIGEAHSASHQLAEAIFIEIQGLEKRIASVLRQPLPTPAGVETSGKRAEPSAHAVGLEALNERLNQSVGYLQSLSARVDL